LKKGTTLLFSLICYCLSLSGQSTFIKTLGASADEEIRSSAPLNDGSFLVMGYTESFGSGRADGYIARINASAKEIWDKAIGASGDDVFHHGIQLSDGNYAVVGWTDSFGNGGNDMLLTKVSIFGEVMWTQTYGGNADDQAFAVYETQDAHILVIGQTQSFGAGNSDVLMVKIDLNGDQIWSKTIGTNNNDWFDGQRISEDQDGNYVFTGAWENANAAKGIDGFLTKLDTDGNVLFTRGYGDNAADDMNGYLRTTTTGFQQISVSSSWTSTDQAIWMTDFTADGDINWSRTFSITGEDIEIRNVTYTNDDHYLISGYESSGHGVGMGAALLIKVTVTGEVVWSKSYGGDDIETLDAVQTLPNGIIAFGKTSTYGQGGNDIFIVRGDGFGTISGCSNIISLTTTDVNPIIEDLTFSSTDVVVGENQTFVISNIMNQENVICDGCNATDLTAGDFCDSAPIICSIDCLDGFTATMPSDFVAPQPEPLCEGNGFPNNLSWFSFVAGSNTIDLTIIPTNCTTIFDETGTVAQTIGIQAGIYADCGFQNSIACHTDGCMDMIAETVNLSSDQFEIGQVYYLFVDGCGGSICDYEVVVNSAQQPFEIQEITSISNDQNIDIAEDTLCLGSELTFTLDGFDQKVDFSWGIDPPSLDYPIGIHPVTDTSSVTFQFNEAGCFDIHVYAFNECDASETRTINVCVEPLADEYFSDIYICQECFPITLVSPQSGCIITEGGGTTTVLTEDPNGDGVSGWFGTASVNASGLVSNEVTNMFGCTYTQFVNVVEIPISPREQVDRYFCITEFPVSMDGLTFTSPGETQNVTLDGEAASGCDSLLSITAHAINFIGIPEIADCESGVVELAIVVQDVPFDDYSSVSYTWFDANLDEVTDSDGIDSILVVTNAGSYSVQVNVEIDGNSCPQTFGFNVDIDNLGPVLPQIGYAPNEVCVDEFQTQIYVMSQGLGEDYIWTFEPDLPFTFGGSSDTVFVDVSSAQNFEFCVYAENGCGSSDDLCDEVKVLQLPEADFSLDMEICIDSVATIVYTGDSPITANTTFLWDFDGGAVNSTDIYGPGPYEVMFPAAGQYTIGLTVSEGGCNSTLTEYTIDVFDAFTIPEITCEPRLGSVRFSWDDSEVEEVDVIALTGQTSITVENGACVIDELSSEEDVEIQVTFNSSFICGERVALASCNALPCPDGHVTIVLSAQDVCLDTDEDIVLDLNVSGDMPESGTWESPFLSGESTFSIELAGVGDHLVQYRYRIGDCFYETDTLIHVYPPLDLEVDVELSLCEAMGSSQLDVYTDEGNTVTLDGMIIENWLGYEVGSGDYILTVSSPQGCSLTQAVTVESQALTMLELLGNTQTIKGKSESYSVSFFTEIEDLEIIWTLGSEIICEDCYTVDIYPDENAELCVTVSYGDGCEMSSCMAIEVSEITELYIPNAFSPNGDNSNDRFTIQSNNTSVFVDQIMIYNRWGELVYNKQSFELGEDPEYWDGSKGNSPCAEGVYVYVITYVNESGERKKITGDLTLVR